jgi:hypothetical protein
MTDALHDSPDQPALTRRQWLTAAGHAVFGAAVLGVAVTPAFAEQPQAARTMTVYKSPTCGCCKAWMEHVQRAGFVCVARDLPDLSETKAAFGIPRALESCHTAQIGRYLVEGHVPVDLILRLLREQPDARGLAVPGMPIGSPGMEGGTPEKYDVLLFDRAGRTRVYASR